MNLGNIFGRENLHSNIKNAASNVENSVRAERSERTMAILDNLFPGKLLKGQVLSIEGNEVLLELSDKSILNARLNQNMELSLGQLLNFEVKSIHNHHIELTPLFANLDHQETIRKALAASGLSETPKNIDMVAKMMNEGMPIDKASLAHMNRLLSMYPGCETETIVQMKRLNLEISGESIEQFNLYKNNQHQINSIVNTLTTELPEFFAEMSNDYGMNKAMDTWILLIESFGQGTEEVSTERVIAGKAGTEEGTAEHMDAQNGTVGNHVPENDGLHNLRALHTELSNLVSLLKNGNIQATGDLTTVAENPDTRNANGFTKQAESDLQQCMEHIDRLLNKEQLTAKDIGLLFRSLQSVAMQQLPEVQNAVNHVLKKMIHSKELQNVLQDVIDHELKLDPKKMDSDAVKRLYEKLNHQTDRLTDILQSVNKLDSSFGKSVQNLHNNIEFMNELNHVFSYVQLPLKMSGNNAHGDLYVYTNKKNLAKKDGSVSALLHLDMKNLGPLDVYVSMQQNKVNTGFTLASEEAVELIEKNIGILDERLAKRGYILSAGVHKREETSDEGIQGIMKNMLNQDRNISLLSRTSFDMRA